MNSKREETRACAEIQRPYRRVERQAVDDRIGHRDRQVTAAGFGIPFGSGFVEIAFIVDWIGQGSHPFGDRNTRTSVCGF